MDFSEALRLLKSGRRLARAGWNGKDMWIRLVGPTQGDPTYPRRAFLEMKDATGQLVPWLASQTDLLAEDWLLDERVQGES